MEELKVLEFDRRGEDKRNRILGEKIATEKNCYWVIPDGSPFFADDNVVVYDARGALLKLGKDYTLTGDYIPLIEIAGREITSFIKLKKEVLEANEFVTVDYTSIGSHYVPRSMLKDWLQRIEEGSIPIDWNTHIFGKPEVYPASLHHHSIKTEIGDWFEITAFFDNLRTFIDTRDRTWEQDMERDVSGYYKQLRDTFKKGRDIVWEHDGNYSAPHKTTKAHVELGNVVNMPTGTTADHINKVPGKLATPQGMKALADTYDYDSEALMRAGVLPISSYGSGSYLPPLIDGSFEGIGSKWASAAMCLEGDGVFTIIGNQYDGRVDDLYFTTIDGYDNPPVESRFTAYRYENERLTQYGVRPNYVLGGSGGDLIAVGHDKALDYVYIALTNGTLDPSKHNYFRVSLANIFSGPAALANFSRYVGGHIALMGDWIYYVGVTDYIKAIGATDIAGTTGARLFRIPLSDLAPGKNPVFQHVPVTFTDMHGIYHEKVIDFFFAVPIKGTDPDGRQYERYVHKIVPVPNWFYYNARNWKLATAEVPGSGGKMFATRFRSRGGWHKVNKAGEQLTSDNPMEHIAHFNPATGVFETKWVMPGVTIDADNMSATQVNATYIGLTDHDGILHHAQEINAMVTLENGHVITSYADDTKTYPRYFYVIKPGENKTRYDSVMGSLGSRYTPKQTWYSIALKLSSPLPSGTQAHMVAWDAQGEYYSAREGNSAQRRWFYRKVTGPYIEREGLTNREVPNIKSRPLTMDVYKSDWGTYWPLTWFTGDDEVLASKGTEMGTVTYATAMFIDGVMPGNPADPWVGVYWGSFNRKVDNLWASFPRTVEKQYDAGNKVMKHIYKSYYGINKAVHDKLVAMLNAPGYNDATALNISVLQQGDTGMASGINYGLASICGLNNTTHVAYMILATVRFTIEAPNVNHPNSYLIKDVTVIDKIEHETTGGGVISRNFGPEGTDHHAHNAAYRNKNGSIEWLVNTGFNMAVVGNRVVQYGTLVTDAEGIIDKANSGVATMGWSMIGSAYQPFPREGRIPVKTHSGGAATIVGGSSGNSYLTASVYPETGWTLFFQEGTKVVFNGTDYVMPSGSVDLRDIEVNPADRIYYIYATIVGEQPKYIVSSIKMRHSPYMMLAAVVTTNRKQIFTIERTQRFMIGNYTLTTERSGGTIPQSVGLPMDEGSLVYVRRNELL